MSKRLPSVSVRETVRAFERAGFQTVAGRGKGSHIVVTRAEPRTILTIPDHRELDRGTLRAIIRQSGLTVDEFVALLSG